MHRLDGKVALITGSGDGMGRAHALLMAQHGADVVVNDLDEAKARDTAARIRDLGRRAVVAIEDVSDATGVTRMVAAAEKELGPVDILVNNAGHGQRFTLEQIDEASIDRMLAVHVKGAFLCTLAVVPGMKAKRYGKIVNVSSIWGMTGAAVASHYCAAKAALLGATKAWAKELAPHNIHVNALAPGGVLSGGPLKFDTPEHLKEKQQRVPLKRFGEPIEMAYAVLFLVSPEADFITGQVISPNGGETVV